MEIKQFLILNPSRPWGVNDFSDDSTVNAVKYSEKVWREKLNALFWKKFMNFPMPGEKGFSAEDQYVIDKKTGDVKGYKSKGNSPIYVVRDLESGYGDTVQFPHVKALEGTGIKGSSGDTLEGQEEAMTVANFDLELDEYSHAVADKSPKGRKRTQFDIIKEMGNQIMSWGLVKTDTLIWDALYAGTATTIIYPGSVTATTQLQDRIEDRMSMTLLRQSKAVAKTRNSGARYIIEPMRMNGKDWWLVVMSEDALYDLKESAEFKQSLQSAGQRGMENPIFAGADYVTVDGLIIYGHERAKNVTNWGVSANVAGARVKLLGVNAICYAMGAAPQLVTQYTDYKRKVGLSYQMLSAQERPTFDGVDYGSLEIRVSRSKITDA